MLSDAMAFCCNRMLQANTQAGAKTFSGITSFEETYSQRQLQRNRVSLGHRPSYSPQTHADDFDHLGAVALSRRAINSSKAVHTITPAAYVQLYDASRLEAHLLHKAPPAALLCNLLHQCQGRRAVHAGLYTRQPCPAV